MEVMNKLYSPVKTLAPEKWAPSSGAIVVGSARLKTMNGVKKKIPSSLSVVGGNAWGG